MLRLVARGMSDIEISNELSIGLRTAKTHLTRLTFTQKWVVMGCYNRYDAIAEVLKNGFVKIDDMT